MFGGMAPTPPVNPVDLMISWMTGRHIRPKHDLPVGRLDEACSAA
jgi:hypothetical protein